ncbi:hypothetical protein HPP92_013934 [Vanilla planifolia]|nr:hypothetical protein HPP92_013934 [Vanilla planifolia]
MVIRLGWKAENMSAYDAFLNTLVRAAEQDEAIKFLKVMKSNNCLPGLKFFGNALDILVKQNDSSHALALWDIMVGDSGLVPNLVMFNGIIYLLCNNQQIDFAFHFLDEMPLYGAFPDSLTYNTIFECLVRNKHARMTEMFLLEMRKNKQLPSSSNCTAAIRMFFDQYDPAAALEVWNWVTEEQPRVNDDLANEVILGLGELGRCNDIILYAEDMLNRGFQLQNTTIEKLKITFQKAGKLDSYDRLARKMKQPQRLE